MIDVCCLWFGVLFDLLLLIWSFDVLIDCWFAGFLFCLFVYLALNELVGVLFAVSLFCVWLVSVVCGYCLG